MRIPEVRGAIRAAVPGLVLLAALLASWVPAQRATEADPMSILRAS